MLGPDVRIVLALLAALMPSLALEVPVLALYSVVFLGSTPIGAPLVGWLSETYDPRAALLLAASAGLLAGVGGYAALARSRSRLGSWNSTEKIASPTTLRASL